MIFSRRWCAGAPLGVARRGRRPAGEQRLVPHGSQPWRPGPGVFYSSVGPV